MGVCWWDDASLPRHSQFVQVQGSTPTYRAASFWLYRCMRRSFERVRAKGRRMDDGSILAGANVLLTATGSREGILRFGISGASSSNASSSLRTRRLQTGQGARQLVVGAPTP